MTKSNLDEHLSWLCISKPSKPPPGLPAPLDVDAAVGNFGDDQEFNTTVAQEEAISCDANASPRDVDASPYQPETNSERPGIRRSDPGTGDSSHEVHPMARLQSGPKSATKNQLLSQLGPTHLTPPVITDTGSSRRQIRDSYNAQFRTQTINTPSKHSRYRSEPATAPTSTASSRKLQRTVVPSTIYAPGRKVDAVDLTGEPDTNISSSSTVEAFGESRPIWREDSASRQEPLRKRGKKRKSEEIDSGPNSQTEEPRSTALGRGRALTRSASPGFVAIESYLDEAPPPYSTNPEQLQAKQTTAPAVGNGLSQSSEHELSEKDQGFTEEEYSVIETRIRTETRRRKSMSRVSSGSGQMLDAAMASPCDTTMSSGTATGCSQGEARLVRQASRFQKPSSKSPRKSARSTQPLPRSQQGKKSPEPTSKRFVADSEDEEEELKMDQSPLEVHSKDDNCKRSNGSIATYPTLPTVREIAEDLPTGTTLEADFSKEYIPEKEIRSNPLMQHLPGKTSAASPFQRDSPTKMASSPNIHTASAQQPSALRANEAEMASVQAFLCIEPSMLQSYLDGLHTKKRSNAEAVYNSLVEGPETSSELTEQAAILSRQIQAVNGLLQLREGHDRLYQKKEDLKRKMIAAIEQDIDVSAYRSELEESKRIAQGVLQAKYDISKLLKEAAWNPTRLAPSRSTDPAQPSYPESRCASQYPTGVPGVVVQSTQTPNHVGRLLPDSNTSFPSSAPAQTQFVRQTQTDRGTSETQCKSQSSAMRESSHDLFGELSPTKASMNSQVHGKPRGRVATPPLDPTDIHAYFSPSKRKLRRLQTPDYAQDHADGPIATQNPLVEQSAISTVSAMRKKATISTNYDGHHVKDAGLNNNDINLQENEFDTDNEPNFDDEEEALYSRTMGSPSGRYDEEDDFGHHDDDEEMLEFAEKLENRHSLDDGDIGAERRQIFVETSGNVLRSQPLKHPLKQSKPAPTSSMLLQHPWSRDVKAAMKERFHLRGFRQNQLEAINATLAGKDAFVLMPTGGGKSLCYQLPSIISSGRTRGVTIVISPLLSLMQDQVDHLQKLKIQAFLINSEVTADHRRLIMESLRHPKVEQFIQLLYVTPEMISKSQAIVNVFKDLHRRGKFARIVIDEAHCVSQWGHDFRPDYKLLGDIRQQFHGVPAMALTATATENVKVDVIHNLGIKGCEVFTQSFNRPNLTYEVRSKGKAKDVLESMANTINSTYKGQSGIIYCLSRQNCEDIAEKLRTEYGVNAHHYHAGMEPREKTTIQKQWQAGKYHVIVATIAFGMGIDKPDVRFVIHHTIPKSLEGYYQETGRAGRDGKRSGCYLYYGYQDTSALKRMIDDGEGSWEQKDRQRKMLRNVVQFCENKSDCRRVQVLLYFNEPFSRDDCNGGCDNCNSTSSFETQDFTDYAVSAVKLVKHLERENVTLLHCVDVFRGSKTKKIIDGDHTRIPEYGVGASLERGEIERLFYRLLSEDAIAEHNVVNKAGWPSQYVHLGNNHADFTSGRRRLKIQVRISPNGKTKVSKKAPRARTTGVAASRQDFPQSTNVSSPVQAASRRHIKRVEMKKLDVELHRNGYERDNFVISDDDAHLPEESEDDDDDAFEPIREVGGIRSARKRKLGPPITIDHKLERLNPTHCMVVDEFMVHAKRECEKIMLDRSLRAQPFTDSVLREMAINFPKDESELLEIRDIDPDKVERYGKKFLKLIRNAENFYENLMRANEDRPQDPNHRNVINISSDDDGDFEAFDELEGDSASQEERSSYFRTAPEVDAFNAQFSQVQTLASDGNARAQTRSRASSTHGGARGGEVNARGNSRSTFRGGFKKAFRKGSGGFSKGKSAGGATKRKKTVANRTSNASSNGFHAGSSRRGGGSGFASGGGIGMMPT